MYLSIMLSHVYICDTVKISLMLLFYSHTFLLPHTRYL